MCRQLFETEDFIRGSALTVTFVTPAADHTQWSNLFRAIPGYTEIKICMSLGEMKPVTLIAIPAEAFIYWYREWAKQHTNTDPAWIVCYVITLIFSEPIYFINHFFSRRSGFQQKNVKPCVKINLTEIK